MALPINCPRGTEVYFSTDNITFTRVLKCTSVSVPGEEVGTTDDTTLDSTSGVKEYAPGFHDPGKFTFKSRFDDTVFETLNTHKASETYLYWKVKLPLRSTQTTNTQFTFRAFLTKWALAELTTGDDAKLEVEAEAQTTGAVTYTKGS